MGLAQAQMGKWERAQENLLTALSLRAEAKFNNIDNALEAILVCIMYLFKSFTYVLDELIKNKNL